MKFTCVCRDILPEENKSKYSGYDGYDFCVECEETQVGLWVEDLKMLREKVNKVMVTLIEANLDTMQFTDPNAIPRFGFLKDLRKNDEM